MGNAGILRRQRKKPDFFNVSEAAKQGLASKPAEPVQDETPEIVAEVCVLSKVLTKGTPAATGLCHVVELCLCRP